MPSRERDVLPEGLVSIEDHAFSWCESLTQVMIPSSVTCIGKGAFNECTSLTQITFADTNDWYFDTDFARPAGADDLAISLKAGKALYKKPPAEWADVNTKAKREMTVLMHTSQNNTNPDVIKEPLDAETVAAEPVAASPSAAAKLDLSELRKDVALGKKTIVVPAEAWDWDLPAIVDCIKSGQDIALDLSETKIKTIGNKAFKSCDALKAIVLPKGLTRIGYGAFDGCKALVQVEIPSSVTTIGDCAFWECEALRQVTIPESVTSIGNNAFGWCSSLEQVTVSESVTSIGKSAFFWCKALRQITFVDTSEWYFEEYFATKVGVDELASSLKVGWALYKKCADASAAYGNTNPNVIKKLYAAKADVNAKSKDGFTELMFAVCNETAAAVEKLLDAGADVNAKNNSGKTALIFTATNNKNPNVFKMLLSARADVNAKDKEGKPAIDYLEARDDKDKFIGTDVYQMMKMPLDEKVEKIAVHEVEVIDNAESDASAVESEARVIGRMDSLTASQRTALASLNLGGKFFLTGSAGTGKSYLIREFIAQQREAGKNVLVAASTGIAAQNIGGATTHRAFNIPVRPLTPEDCQKAFPPKTVTKADVIVIDEVSMLRFDVCEFILAIITKCPNNPTVVFVGDFGQLPPVIKTEEKKVLCKLWDLDETERGFAFQAQAWKDAEIKTLQLREVVRQADEHFSGALEEVRRGEWSGVKWIYKHSAMEEHKGAVGLYAKNEVVSVVNEIALAALKGSAFVKEAEFYGDATEEDFNGDVLFKCKEGARVISLVNAKDGWSYQNGSVGTVTKIDRAAEEITVDFDVEGQAVILPYVWLIKSYKVEDGKLVEFDKGRIRQMPLKLAYALTIHKSQGQTFSQVNLDPYCFDDGHLYVALSRCRSVDGLYFTAPPKREYLMSSQQVRAFYEG